jgi:hypothetical protein
VYLKDHLALNAINGILNIGAEKKYLSLENLKQTHLDFDVTEK